MPSDPAPPTAIISLGAFNGTLDSSFLDLVGASAPEDTYDRTARFYVDKADMQNVFGYAVNPEVPVPAGANTSNQYFVNFAEKQFSYAINPALAQISAGLNGSGPLVQSNSFSIINASTIKQQVDQTPYNTVLMDYIILSLLACNYPTNQLSNIDELETITNEMADKGYGQWISQIENTFWGVDTMHGTNANIQAPATGSSYKYMFDQETYGTADSNICPVVYYALMNADSTRFNSPTACDWTDASSNTLDGEHSSAIYKMPFIDGDMIEFNFTITANSGQGSVPAGTLSNAANAPSGHLTSSQGLNIVYRIQLILGDGSDTNCKAANIKLSPPYADEPAYSTLNSSTLTYKNGAGVPLALADPPNTYNSNSFV